MENVTISHRYLSLNVDRNGTITLARTDKAQVIQISVSEWNWLVSVMGAVQTPVHPPIEPANE